MKNFRKVILCLSFIILLLRQVNAQVNYTFSYQQATFTPLTNGITAVLDNPNPTGYYAQDEGFANFVPLGFTFTFNNVAYQQIHINANGFISFGTPFENSVSIQKYNENNLSEGPKNLAARPIIAPLWDDFWLNSKNCITYKTTGSAPNRIFTVQWDSICWNFNALKPAVRIQLHLHEATNKIIFSYEALDGNTSAPSASIGITGSLRGSNSFLSINQFNNGGASSIKEFNEIATKPITGTSIVFEPGKCAMPFGIKVDDYNARRIRFSFDGLNGYQFDYAVTTSALHPTQFNTTTQKQIIETGLTPATQYYIHIRSSLSNGDKSGWLSFPFTTAYTTTLPYQEKFEQTNTASLPKNTLSIQPTGGNGWSVKNLPNSQPYNQVISFTGDTAQNANAWFVLPAAALEGGLTYKLKFAFKTNDSLQSDQKLEIRIGRNISTAMSGWQLLHRNLKINNSISFKDTSFLFSASATDEFFIAFRCTSDKNLASLFIDEIVLEKLKQMPVKILSFTGKRVGIHNEIQWKTSAENNNKFFELERSSDGRNFSSFKRVETKAVNGTSAVTLTYDAFDTTKNLADYYRLKIVGENGEAFFSQVIKVVGTMPFKIVAHKTFPNPAINIVNLVVYSPFQAKANIKVLDAFGRLLQTFPGTVVIGDNIFTTNISHLPKGQYYIKVDCIIGSETNALPFTKL